MSINIYSVFGLFALISKSELEPVLGSRFNDRALHPQCREYDFVYMLAQCLGCDSAQVLSSKINVYVMQDWFIVEERVVAFPWVYFTRREMMMLQEIQQVVSNLTSKIRAFAHLMRDFYACLEAWLLARLGFIVACVKLYIFRYSDKYGEFLDRMLWVVLLNVLEAGLYDLYNVCRLVALLLSK